MTRLQTDRAGPAVSGLGFGASTAAGPPRSILDSHVHFWDPRRLTYSWLNRAPALHRPFLPDAFLRDRTSPVDVIFVEAGRAPREAAAEIEWVRRAARTHPWILGAVAHAGLEHRVSAAAALRRFTDDPFIVGVRRNIQDEPPGFTANPDFRAGLRALGAVGLPFDACVREQQLQELAELAAACAQTTIILDHLGKPRSATMGGWSWRQALRRLAKRENVVCKLSGLTTELARGATHSLMLSIVAEALDVFGPERCMYGSDWPAITLTAHYESWLGLVRSALARFPPESSDAVLRSNAARIYRLSSAPSPATGTTGKESA